MKKIYSLVVALCFFALSQNINAQTYCIPTYDSANCVTNDFINNFSTTGGITNISNLNSGCSSSTTSGNTANYTYFTAAGDTLTIEPGMMFNFSLTITTLWTEGVVIWADWNHDFVFDSLTEVVYSQATSVAAGGTITGSCLVPANAVVGATRLRAKCAYNNPAVSPCTGGPYGEIEDYPITVNPITPQIPVANFVGSPTTISIGQAVNYTDLSTHVPTSWLWTFSGGTPATSTSQNPTNIVYSAVGAYDVTLIATNSTGSDTITFTAYVNVSAVCLTGLNPACNTTDFISNVSILNTTLNSTSTCNGTTDSYTSFPASGSTTANLSIGSNCILNVTSTANSIISCWIDYNHDYVFDASEWTQVTTSSTAGNAATVTVNIPGTATNGLTYMRIRSRSAGSVNTDTSACSVFFSGETEDYQVSLVVPVAAIPVADFIANLTAINVGQSVNFTDLSTGVPTSWAWTFTGGTPATSNQQNPSNIFYNTAGTYAVSLTVTNALGNNTKTTAGYITVTLADLCISALNPACDSTDYISNVSITNTNLNSTSACDGTNGDSYSAFPATGSTTAFLAKGTTYELNVSTSADNIISCWIDYNNNNIFTADEWVQVCTTSVVGTPNTVNITIPTSAANGLVHMRIRSRAVANPNGDVDACTVFGSGETEDYQVTLTTGGAGIFSYESNSDFNLFPNPANEYLNVVSSSIDANTKVEVTDLTGKIVLTEKITSANAKLNIQQLNSGLYFVKIYNNNQSRIKKFVKE